MATSFNSLTILWHRIVWMKRLNVTLKIWITTLSLWDQSRHFLRISLDLWHLWQSLSEISIVSLYTLRCWIRYDLGFIGWMTSVSISIGFFTRAFSLDLNVVNGLALWLLSNDFMCLAFSTPFAELYYLVQASLELTWKAILELGSLAAVPLT